MSDLIYDISRHEYSDKDKVSLDFRLRVPKAPHEDLKSSATVQDGSVGDFELRLGLLSKSQYNPDEIRMEVYAILDGMDLPDHDPAFLSPGGDRVPTDEFTVKIAYDPHWGEVGFYQIHLNSHTFFPLEMDEDEFEAFVRKFTTEFIERFEWDE